MHKIVLLIIALLTAAISTQAEDAMVEKSGFILDIDRSRNALVLGSTPADVSGKRLAIHRDALIFSEKPIEMTNIYRGASLEVRGQVQHYHITATHITALAVEPEEGRYKNRVIGVLERENGQLKLLVKKSTYTLKVSPQAVIRSHQRVTLDRLRKGQELRIMVQQNELRTPEARQIIFYPSLEEKIEEEEILL